MTALVIIIEDVPGHLTERTVRENAEALAFRLGGTCTAARPVIETSVPQALLRILRDLCAGNAARLALARSRLRAALCVATRQG